MNTKMTNSPDPYILMRDQGASSTEIFQKALEDGYKNFECIALLCGVFDMPLHEARTIAHEVYALKKKEVI